MLQASVDQTQVTVVALVSLAVNTALLVDSLIEVAVVLMALRHEVGI